MHITVCWEFTILVSATDKQKLWVTFSSSCVAPLLETPVTYCAANTSDLERVVQHVKRLYPHAPLLGAGVSLGG